MELSQLRYFLVVAELGNMSRAAEMLYVSQPNLSTSITRLEDEVGAPLFERRRGRITLTHNGEMLMKSVKKAMNTLEAGIQTVRDQNSSQSPVLSLGCMVDDTNLLRQFVLKYPSIYLNQQRADLSIITTLLRTDDIELALTVLPPASEEITYERIYHCRYVVLMNRRHPLAGEQMLTRQQLAGLPMAIDGSRLNRITFCATESSKFGFTPNICYDVRNLELLLSLVESNRCITLIPLVKYKELFLLGKYQDIIFKDCVEGTPEAYWGIAHNKRSPLSEQGLIFSSFAQDYFNSVDKQYELVLHQ